VRLAEYVYYNDSSRTILAELLDSTVHAVLTEGPHTMHTYY